MVLNAKVEMLVLSELKYIKLHKIEDHSSKCNISINSLVGIIYITMSKYFFTKVNSEDISFQTKVNNEDPFSSATSSSISSVAITKNMLEETSVKNEDVPPALPPKIGTPTRPCPPPPGESWYLS